MSIDFVEAARDLHFNPPVRSLLDVDFYKFTMGNYIHTYYPNVEVKFQLIVRDQDLPIGDIVSEALLDKYLQHARGLTLSYSDLAWLRGMRVYGKNMFSEEYTEFLENFKLPPYKLSKRDGQFILTFTGKWLEVSMWETIGLAIVSELYYRTLMEKMHKNEIDILYCRAKDRIYSKLEKLQQYPGIKFADFGQRRRHSFLWQEYVLGLCKDMLGEQFSGTSNTWMAFKHDLTPIGTNAHELPCVLTALAVQAYPTIPESFRYEQYSLLEKWASLYGTGLRVFLPDTFGTKQFLDKAPSWLAHNWKGFRQDSGDPIRQGHLYLEFLRRYNVDPKEKLIIFSDGLDVHPMIELYEYFGDQINVGFGWGTLLTNDFRGGTVSPLFKPFSMVCKAVEARKDANSPWTPVVKLSDNINKATGDKDEIARYIDIFGDERTAEPIVV